MLSGLYGPSPLPTGTEHLLLHERLLICLVLNEGSDHVPVWGVFCCPFAFVERETNLCMRRTSTRTGCLSAAFRSYSNRNHILHSRASLHVPSSHGAQHSCPSVAPDDPAACVPVICERDANESHSYWTLPSSPIASPIVYVYGSFCTLPHYTD